MSQVVQSPQVTGASAGVVVAGGSAYAAPQMVGGSAYGTPQVVQGGSSYGTPQVVMGGSTYAAPQMVGGSTYAAPQMVGGSTYAAPQMVGGSTYATAPLTGSSVVLQGGSQVVQPRAGATSVFQPAYSTANYVAAVNTSQAGYETPGQYLQQYGTAVRTGAVTEQQPFYVMPAQKEKKRRSCC
mmetsp:Transcript_7749/g.18841  ORF Transcript_7749/g.18841 Transcript_7749/m.18841 type:complete len:183 (+) Transcript_7749:61-609(+)